MGNGSDTEVNLLREKLNNFKVILFAKAGRFYSRKPVADARWCVVVSARLSLTRGARLRNRFRGGDVLETRFTPPEW